MRDGGNGYLVDADAQIAARVGEILADEAQWRALSDNGLALAARFSAAAHVDRLESLYERVLSGSLA